MKEPASVSMVFSVALLFPVPALVCITIMTLSLLVQALVWIWPSLWIFFLRQGCFKEHISDVTHS